MRLIADNLSGERGGDVLFSGVGATLGEGGALVVTGPNGSGKSTFLRVAAGLLPAAGGRIFLEDGGADWPAVAAASHYLGHLNGMKAALSVAENLKFWQQFLGCAHYEPDAALDLVGLGDIGHLPFGYLSTGQRRRVAIARLLVSFRPIWLLDEPTAGLDAWSQRQFTDLMRAHLDDGGMIIAATHLPLGLGGAQELKLGPHSPLRGG